MVRGKIYHEAGAHTAQGLSLDEILDLIRSAGKTPAERDSFYNTLRVFDRLGARPGGQGAVVPYADEGAEVIDGHTGERTTLRGKPMRGIKSEGMVLSAKELGLGEDHDGTQLLDPKLPVGALLREVLGETILALDVQPNRPDCLGIVGVAREVAALLATALREAALDAHRGQSDDC